MPNFNSVKLFFSRRMLIILSLGISSGIPLALTSTTLQAWFTLSNIPIFTIGLLGLAGQPYAYKFLWAPLLDRYAIPGLGRRRGWMLLMQCALIATLMLMAGLTPQQHAGLLAFFALLTAFFSATQDIAIDAYRTDLLNANERGFGAALFVTGYRIGMLLSGGVALIMAAKTGWHFTYLCMAGLMGIGVIAACTAPALTHTVKAPQHLHEAIIQPIAEFFNRKNAIMILLFIIFYKIGDAFSSSLLPAFLIRDLGFSLIDVGTINKGAGLIATIIGAIMGGVLLARYRLATCLFGFGILQAISILPYTLLAIHGHHFWLMAIAICVENFCAGMVSTGLVALLMSLCDTRYTAAQFALLSAVSALSRIVISPLAAVLVEHIGWTQFYFWAFLSALPALGLLFLLKNNLSNNQAKNNC